MYIFPATLQEQKPAMTSEHAAETAKLFHTPPKSEKVNKRRRTYLECLLIWSQLRRRTVCRMKLLKCTAATGSELGSYTGMYGLRISLAWGEPTAARGSPHNFGIILAVWGLAREKRLKPSSLSRCNMLGNLASPSEDVKEKIYTTVVSGRLAARFTWVVVMGSDICVQDTVNNHSLNVAAERVHIWLGSLQRAPLSLLPCFWSHRGN